MEKRAPARVCMCVFYVSPIGLQWERLAAAKEQSSENGYRACAVVLALFGADA